MGTYGASIDDIKVHSELTFQDERKDLFASTDGYAVMAAPFGMELLGGEVNADVEIFLQPLKE